MINRSLIVAFVFSIAGHGLLLSFAPSPSDITKTKNTFLNATLQLITPTAPPPLPTHLPSPIPPQPKTIAPRTKAPLSQPFSSPSTEEAKIELPSEPIATPDSFSETKADSEPVSSSQGELDNVENRATHSAETLSIEGWPEQGAITYRVYLGDSGFLAGEAEHQWWHDEHTYRMELNVKTVGVATLMHNLKYRQYSEGLVSDTGLKPTAFDVTQHGKTGGKALFNWPEKRVSIQRGGTERRSAMLNAGDQDILSIWHQIGIIGTTGLPYTLLIVGNKDAKRALLEAAGTERLDLPIGELNTLRLKAQSEDKKLSIDIWLAIDYGMLPVRTRLMDHKGEVLDQKAVQLRIARPSQKQHTIDSKAPSLASPLQPPDMIELKEEQNSNFNSHPYLH